MKLARGFALVCTCLLCLLHGTWAATSGYLLGKVNAHTEAFQQVGQGRYMLVPGIPELGKAVEKPILIAIIDSGVASRHPQLSGYLLGSADFTGEGVEDVLGHGTAVALIALFSQREAQPGSAILSAKVVTQDGRITQKAVTQAIDWAVARGARIINLSLGFEGPKSDFRILCNTIKKHSKVIFLAAAGNSGPEVSVYPASCGIGNLMSVAEINAEGTLAPSSGQGSIAAPSNSPFISHFTYYYEAGQVQALAGNYAEATALYEKSLAVEANPESLFQLGVLQLHAHQPVLAKDYFEQALQLFPAMPEAREHLGLAYFLVQDFDNAERELRYAVALAPGVANIHFNLGLALEKQGRLHDAKASFTQAKLLNPQYNKADRALQRIQQQLDTAPSNTYP